MTITPEQAANETEALWKARRAGRETDAHCGWCELQAQSGCLPCQCCPVQQVAGQPCGFLIVYGDYQRATTDEERRDAAAVVYDLLVENRERLLLAAKEILDETKNQTTRTDLG